MALKNAAAGLPLGGAKSGLRADPNAPDFEKTYRRFVKLCAPILHENGGPFGGFGFDIGGRPEHALWAVDELQSSRCFTGKPLDKGGTDYDREGIAGLGVATAAVAAAKSFGFQVPDLTFAVQGVGAMGAAVIRYFSLNGSWHMAKGASEELINALAHGDISAAQQLLATDATPMSPQSDAVLYAICDVLFPCAVQNVITADNVGSIHAKIVAEGANGPTALECYPLLAARGITVIPDFIANPGGIIAAFVELTSDVSIADNIQNRTKAEQAKALTVSKITDNVAQIMQTSVGLGVTPREAGLDLAYRRILGRRILGQ
jgi:glutamate dehydrogenase (NAD(P)+)